MTAAIRTRTARTARCRDLVGCRPARTAPGAPGRARRRLLGAAAGDRIGVRGQDRRHVQRDRRRQPAHGAAARARRPGGRQARARPGSASSSASRAAPGARWRASVNTLIDDLLWPTTEVTRAIARGGAGRPAADRAARRRRPAAQGRVPALGHHRQHDDQAARRVHLRGDARGARGRHRRQARRPGAGAAR